MWSTLAAGCGNSTQSAGTEGREEMASQEDIKGYYQERGDGCQRGKPHWVPRGSSHSPVLFVYASLLPVVLTHLPGPSRT